MMRACAFNLHVDPVIAEMTGTQQILSLRVFDLDKSESKGIIADKDLLQVCSTGESESESVIFDESYMEEIK